MNAGKGDKRRPTDEKAFGNNMDLIQHREMIKELLEVVAPCNPQCPEINDMEGDECPQDHKNKCGRCDVVHRARKLLNKPI